METKNALTPNNILERAKLVLKIESEEIKAQIDKLDQKFINACEMILSSKGRVIVTGM